MNLKSYDDAFAVKYLLFTVEADFHLPILVKLLNFNEILYNVL